MSTRRFAGKLADSRGQSMVEFALTVPLVMLLVLGVLDVGYVLLDQHVVTKLTREGSNLISRDTPFETAANAMRTMSSAPVDFDTRSRLIFSVIRRGSTVGSANYDQLIMYQRYETGALSASTKLQTAGPASFGGAPNYEAANSDNNTNLRVTNVPSGLVPSRGAMVYVTEVYTTHSTITPIQQFGIPVPTTLYSIAYF
jgi:Flp pilus assembly protein TadG